MLRHLYQGSCLNLCCMSGYLPTHKNMDISLNMMCLHQFGDRDALLSEAICLSIKMRLTFISAVDVERWLSEKADKGLLRLNGRERVGKGANLLPGK